MAVFGEVVSVAAVVVIVVVVDVKLDISCEKLGCSLL